MGGWLMYPDSLDSLDEIFSGVWSGNWQLPPALEVRNDFTLAAGLWPQAQLPEHVQESEAEPLSDSSDSGSEPESGSEEEWTRDTAFDAGNPEVYFPPAAQGGGICMSRCEDRDSESSYTEDHRAGAAPAAPAPLPRGYRSTRPVVPLCWCNNNVVDVPHRPPAQQQAGTSPQHLSARDRRMAEDAEFERALNSGLFAPPRRWTDEDRIIRPPQLVDSRRCLDLQPGEMGMPSRSARNGSIATGPGSVARAASATQRGLERAILSTAGPTCCGNTELPKLKPAHEEEVPEKTIDVNFEEGVHIAVWGWAAAEAMTEYQRQRVALQLCYLPTALVQHPPAPHGFEFARGSLTAEEPAHLESTGLEADLSQLTIVEEADSTVPACRLRSGALGHSPYVDETSASGGGLNTFE